MTTQTSELPTLAAPTAPSKKVNGVKIAQVISRLCIGGTPVAVILMTEALLHDGFSTILLAGEVTAGEASMEEFAFARGVELVRVRNLSQRASLWGDLKALLELRQLFRRERPVIVHTHTAKAGALGRIAARLAGVPICVHTFHGHVFRGHFSQIKSHIYLAVERLLARWTDCLVAVSESQGRELTERYRVAPARKLVTIPVRFDMERYLNVSAHRELIRELAGCSSDTPLIGWVGRMAAVKHPELFVDVARLTSQISPKARFVMAGDGELRATVENRLNEMGLSSAVTRIGWQTDLSDFYADIDLLVLTSRHEGTPLALLEAMASGKPFVTTDVGGIRDLMAGTPRVEDGFQVFRNGILANSSASSLTAAIQYLLNRPTEAFEMGLAGRSFVSQMFAADRVAGHMERLYVRLLQQKHLY